VVPIEMARMNSELMVIGCDRHGQSPGRERAYNKKDSDVPGENRAARLRLLGRTCLSISLRHETWPVLGRLSNSKSTPSLDRGLAIRWRTSNMATLSASTHHGATAMMNSGSSTIQRAYDLAQTGGFSRISDLVTRLRSEGYHDAQAQLDGRMIRSTLRRLMSTARYSTRL
jgi:hypothetical protein